MWSKSALDFWTGLANGEQETVNTARQELLLFDSRPHTVFPSYDHSFLCEKQEERERESKRVSKWVCVFFGPGLSKSQVKWVPSPWHCSCWIMHSSTWLASLALNEIHGHIVTTRWSGWRLGCLRPHLKLQQHAQTTFMHAALGMVSGATWPQVWHFCWLSKLVTTVKWVSF